MVLDIVRREPRWRNSLAGPSLATGQPLALRSASGDPGGAVNATKLTKLTPALPTAALQVNRSPATTCPVGIARKAATASSGPKTSAAGPPRGDPEGAWAR